jgi:transcriptional regulator GlxA family with amidase domain
MRIWQADSTETQEVAVLLFPRFSNHCLANAVEPLRAANEFLMRPAYRWAFVTMDGAAVSSSSGLPVLPNCALRDHPGGAYLLVVSSYDVRRFATAEMRRALRAASPRFSHVVGMDTGAWLMAQAGLLDGATATIHWDELTAFSETFAQVDVVAERYVIDGRRITCGGAMTAFDLVLDLLGRTHGEALRLEVAGLFMHQMIPAPQEPLYRPRTSPLVARGLAIMSDTLEAPLKIAELAARLNTTQRSLARAFQSDLGAAPMTVYKRLRLAAARRYAVHASYSVQEIALRCGYRNAAAMTRAFVEQYGKPPTAMRDQG